MNLPQPPFYLSDMYRQPDAWESYDSSKGYKKKPCAIKLKNGGGFNACWPNAGKFISLDDSSIHVPCEDVIEVAYYVGLDEIWVDNFKI